MSVYLTTLFHLLLYAGISIATEGALPADAIIYTVHEATGANANRPVQPLPTPAPGVVNGLRGQVGQKAVPSQTPGCKTDQCYVVYPSVEVFYWPSSAPNTACLSTIKNPPSRLSQPTGMVSPYPAVVIPAPTVYDGCGTVRFSPPSPSLSTTYTSLFLLTVAPAPTGVGAPALFDFADLPCPPPAIAAQIEPGALYTPLLWPTWWIELVGAGGNASMICEFTATLDPPVAAQAVGELTGEGDWGVPP